MATGSEVGLAVQAAERLEQQGHPVRVVSMPCIERFLAQDSGYRDQVLPPSLTARVAVEAAAPDSWYRLVGDRGDVVGLNGFGASAPGSVVYEHMGLTADAVVSALESRLAG